MLAAYFGTMGSATLFRGVHVCSSRGSRNNSAQFGTLSMLEFSPGACRSCWTRIRHEAGDMSYLSFDAPEVSCSVDIGIFSLAVCSLRLSDDKEMAASRVSGNIATENANWVGIDIEIKS